jgi:predicted esterase
VIAGAPVTEARAAALVVHGRDQTDDEMLDFVRRLDLDDVAYVLPAAVGRTWYPGRFFEPVERNEPWLSEAIEVCEAAVDWVAAAGMQLDRTVLTGFSQGACITAEFVARRPRPYAGIALLTGALMGTAEEIRARAVALEGLPVFVSGSEQDEWVPVECVRLTAEAFEAWGAHVELRVADDVEHRIRDEEVEAVRGLLAAAGGGA